jgi:hypothetical protein
VGVVVGRDVRAGQEVVMRAVVDRSKRLGFDFAELGEP